MTYNPYTANGYKSRLDYLTNLAEDHDVPLQDVLTIANTLGPNEDFDGLVTTLQDYADSLEMCNDKQN